MEEKEKTINVRLDDYEKPGLYLTLKDSTRLLFTKENIEKATMEYWMNPKKIPPDVKEGVEFQRCEFCPMKGEDDLCDALRPTIPLLDAVDKFMSFDEVISVYKGEGEGLCHVSYTTMQRALRFITNLSLLEYCQVGRKYWKYFSDVNPTMQTQEIANRLYLNMYWAHNGNKDSIDKLISELHKEISVTTKNQMARLRLICQNDSFLNAFVLTHMIADVLYANKDRKLEEFRESL
ncbi:MAG: hypothetical protein HN737_07065 [Desulfobacterales bacterium]|nr:hypothetical protein [Desulfobacteraceae bacterium]MBT7086390.1 hypothetical protein [Desulfobacterales bacterium]MBT7697155.1 hypothetical protein [Desulfobacterales bacterium]